jgi:hypothetical protein
MSIRNHWRRERRWFINYSVYDAVHATRQAEDGLGWIPVGIGTLATYGFYSASDLILALIAGALTAINFWSYGVMHNLAVEAAKARDEYRGGFGDFTDGDLCSVPNWLTNVNLATSILLLALLLWAGIASWS